MKSTGIRMLAVPVLLAATVSFASAQEGAKQQARETTQDAKDAAKKTGNAISDSWITLKVHSQFVPEDALSDSDIDVDTKSGVVTLNGTVASEAGRAKAIAIAKATDGVNAVTDNLKVAPAADMTASAKAAGEKAGDKTRDVAGHDRQSGHRRLDQVEDCLAVRDRGSARQERHRHRRRRRERWS